MPPDWPWASGRHRKSCGKTGLKIVPGSRSNLKKRERPGIETGKGLLKKPLTGFSSAVGFLNHFQERLGFLPANAVKSLSGSPRIWIHGASLGEIRVAAGIIKSLRTELPGCAVIVSTMTEHGRNLAREIFETFYCICVHSSF